MADGYVGAFDTKYKDPFWRPVTAIRLAGTDGNPGTAADPTWSPLVTTPPIPDHDSAHAVEGAAAATVLRRFFGADRVRFAECSRALLEMGFTDVTPVLRHFSSFSQAAAENGLSRILIGFHFRRAVVVGLGHGRAIGNHAVDGFLRPVRRG
jgi:hypothetical protein